MDRKTRKMNRLFRPQSVAVVGASDNMGKLGAHVMKSLTQGGYKGAVFPVNPKSGEIWGIRAFPSLTACDGPVDLAVVVVPAQGVADVFRECVETDVGGVVLITAGFKEIEDPLGAERHEEIRKIAQQADIPVIGPNTFGMINFHESLNASFTPEFSRIETGGVCLVSQSGGISHLLGFSALREEVRFSKIVGLGNRLNVDFAEMLGFLETDEETRAVALYIEGIDDPRTLLAAAASCRKKKPVVAYKTGSASVGDAAAHSHTGSLAGRHEIYTGSLRQAGVVVADSTEALLDSAKALAACPSLPGPGVAVLSGQAGPGMAACDMCQQMGLEVVRFGQGTQERINELLPPLALRTNPVDMGPAWYNADAIRGIIDSVLADPAVDGILLLMMFASANIDAVAGISEMLIRRAGEKPVVGCLVAPPGIWDSQVRELEKAKALVNFPTPERAARALAALGKAGLPQTGVRPVE